MKTIRQYHSGRDNNFNLIRFLAAASVIFSHATLISQGQDAIEPLKSTTGFTLGDHAVNVFFVLSGFLVTMSLQRRGDPVFYAASRAARLVPGVFAAGLVTALVIGPILTSLPLPGYFRTVAVWTYAPLIGSIFSDPLNLYLPGVFDGNPFPAMVNGPLWTIRYEVIAYAGLVAVSTFGLYASRQRFVVFLGLFVLAFGIYLLMAPWPATPNALDHLARLGFCFMLGSAAWMLRHHIPLSFPLALTALALVWAMAGTPFYRGALFLFTAYAVLWLALVPGGLIRQFNRLGDYSYGLYIYGWPVAQGVIACIPGLSPLELFGASVLLSLLVAMASWHCIEKPALARRDTLAAGLRRLLPKRPAWLGG